MDDVWGTCEPREGVSRCGCLWGHVRLGEWQAIWMTTAPTFQTLGVRKTWVQCSMWSLSSSFCRAGYSQRQQVAASSTHDLRCESEVEPHGGDRDPPALGYTRFPSFKGCGARA